jgi:HEAT repeat protein
MTHSITQWINDLSSSAAATRRAALVSIQDYLKHQSNPQLMMQVVSHVLAETDPALTILTIQTISKLKLYSGVDVLVLVMRADKALAIFQVAHLSDDHRLNVRRAAIMALGQIGEQRVIPYVMKILNNRRENYRLRLAAAECLGKLGDPKATTPLVDILTDERENSLYLKESAAKALGMLGDIRALESLIDVLDSKQGFKDKFNFLKEQVIEAIGSIGQNLSGRKNNRALDSLFAALNDEAPSIRLAAIQAIEQLGDTDCLPFIHPILFDVEFDIACAAASCLYNLGGEDAIRRALQDDNLPHVIRDELEAYIP